MDQIQKVLIKTGRKDLAQKYYENVMKKADVTKDLKKTIIKKLQDAVRKISVTNNAEKILNLSSNTVNELEELVRENKYIGRTWG
jgi:hypothetical protein